MENPYIEKIKCGRDIYFALVYVKKMVKNKEQAKQEMQNVINIVKGKKINIDLLTTSDIRPSGSALMYAAFDGCMDIVELLVDNADATIDLVGSYPGNFTALIDAAMMGRTRVLNYLISKGASIYKENGFGFTALTWAADQGKITSVKALVEALEKDIAGKQKDITEKIKFLNHKDKEGKTPLIRATNNCHKRVVQFLLREGADPSLVDNNGKDAQAYTDNQEILKLFKYNKMFTKRADSERLYSTLILAKTDEDKKDIINSISKYSDVTGATLYMAVEKNNLSLVKLLLSKRADPNVQCTDLKCTPLMIAVMQGNLEMVDLLLKYGAKTHFKNVYGSDVFEFAEVFKFMTVGQPGSYKIYEEMLHKLKNAQEENRDTRIQSPNMTGTRSVVSALVERERR